MTDAPPDPFAALEAGSKAEPFAVGFRKSDGEALVYGTVFLGVIFLVVGIVAGMPLLSAGALVPLAISFWHYPMIDRSVPQLGANKDGLFVERLGFLDWGAVKSLDLTRTSVRSIQLVHLNIHLTRPVAEAKAKPQAFPVWKQVMMRNWRIETDKTGAETLRVQLNTLNADPDDILARIKDFLHDIG